MNTSCKMKTQDAAVSKHTECEMDTQDVRHQRQVNPSCCLLLLLLGLGIRHLFCSSTANKNQADLRGASETTCTRGKIITQQGGEWVIG
jgi:hypothetical protein